MKYSKQREVILEAVLNSHEHPTAYDVFTEVRKTGPNISLGTVYRNLNMLCELGKIRRIDAGNSLSVRFDSTFEHHNHIYCEKCGEVCDVEVGELKNMIYSIESKTGFEIMTNDLIFKGKCAKCRNEGSE